MKVIPTSKIVTMVAPAAYKAGSFVTMDQEVFGNWDIPIDSGIGVMNAPAFEVFGGHLDPEITYFFVIFVDSFIDNHGS
jgi:hypothetical protein